VHDAILLSSDSISEMDDSPVPALRPNRAPTTAPVRRLGDDNARVFRRAHVQRSYDQQMPYNNLIRPQAHPVFFAQPPPLFPPGHGVLLRPEAHTRTQGLPTSAALFAHHGFNHYPVPMMPMFGQPSYHPYQYTAPPAFPPDSWLPMPNFGLPFAQNRVRNPFGGR